MTRIPSHFVRKTVALLGAALLMLDMFTCFYSCLLFVISFMFFFVCFFGTGKHGKYNYYVSIIFIIYIGASI